MKINSMNGLMKFLLDIDQANLYRGQRESFWKLESSLTRTISSNSKFQDRGYIIEKYILAKFTENAHLFDKSFDNKSSDFAKLTHAQHHGAPTRLLDLTSSKLIALFFAFDDVSLESGSKYVRIWIINKRQIENKENTPSAIKINGISAPVSDSPIMDKTPTKAWDHVKRGNDKLYILKPEINNKRSHIQDSHFICSGDIDRSIHSIYEGGVNNIV